MNHLASQDPKIFAAIEREVESAEQWTGADCLGKLCIPKRHAGYGLCVHQ